jgi:hypothetical protein
MFVDNIETYIYHTELTVLEKVGIFFCEVRSVFCNSKWAETDQSAN